MTENASETAVVDSNAVVAPVKTGPQTTVAKGMTRGRNPREIEYLEFNRELPGNIPKTMKEFMDASGVQEEAGLVEFLVTGFNESQYKAATDEIGEFINPQWDNKTQDSFRLAVRNYSKISGDTIEDAVALIKPGVEKKFNREQEAAAEAAKNAAANTTAVEPATVGV